MRNYSIGVFFEIFNKDKNQWKKQIDRLTKLRGVEHLEVLLEDTTLNKSDITYLKTLLGNYTIGIHAPFITLHVMSYHKEISEASITILRRTANIGKKLNARYMTIHLETYPINMTLKEAGKRAIKAIRAISYNLPFPILIENLSIKSSIQTAFPSTNDEICSLAKSLPPNTGITIDIGHTMRIGENPYQLFRTVNNYVGNIHFHDIVGGRDHQALGTGDLDIPLFLKILEQKKYNKFLTLEVIGEKKVEESWKYLVNLLRIAR